MTLWSDPSLEFEHLQGSFLLSRWLFLRTLGLTYLAAFLSLLPQLPGLVGSEGILPATWLLESVRTHLGWQGYLRFPTLAWINAGDLFLQGLALAGALVAALLIMNLAPRLLLILLWALYLSLVVVGQDFLNFQWDALLLEAGFLAIFIAPIPLRPKLAGESPPATAFRLLLWFLLFRLMVGSGVVKLASGDPAWRNLTALTFHYQTQPLPTPVAWYLSQLPFWFHQLSAILMFAVELAVPFLLFAPRRLRHGAAAIMIGFQLLIALSGNYAFFNLLTIALCLLCFDDALLGRLLPRAWGKRLRPVFPRARPKPIFQWLSLSLAGFLFLAGLFQLSLPLLRVPLDNKGRKLLQWLDAPRVVNSYGLFAVMTTSRPEIIIEGSADGTTWLPYEFNYKPGDLHRRPPWVAPHQPRLDWQLWFAALGPYQQSPWFSSLMVRLLQGSPAATSLLAGNPFPDHPPRFIRASLYDYRFTSFETQTPERAWWSRRYLGLYFPPTSLAP